MKDDTQSPRQGTRPLATALTTSVVVAYVAIGAAAILGRSLRDAARETLTWLLSRDGTRGNSTRRARSEMDSQR